MLFHVFGYIFTSVSEAVEVLPWEDLKIWLFVLKLSFGKLFCSFVVLSLLGTGGRDWGGVCSADACGVRAEGPGNSKRTTAVGGAGGGAGLSGAGTEPCRPGHGGPPDAVHSPGPAPLLCKWSGLLRQLNGPCTQVPILSQTHFHVAYLPISISLFQKNVHSTRFLTYFCDHVLPNLSSLTSPVAELDIQLEVSHTHTHPDLMNLQYSIPGLMLPLYTVNLEPYVTGAGIFHMCTV